MKKNVWLANKFRTILTSISPKLNTKVTYFVKFHKRLDLDNPVTLNEKILWLKFNTYWNNPLVKQCADKFKVREYIDKCGLSSILNELIDVYESPEQIEWEKLPQSFALKLNIGCGFNYIVPDKNKEDFVSVKKEVARWIKLSKTQYLSYSEMQYKDVKPYILVEKYLGRDTGELPDDYKFYCLNGKAQYVMICVDRKKGKHAKFYYFDRNWSKMPYSADYFADPDRVIPKPAHIDEAFDVAEKLSKEFPFVRTDLYIVGDKIIFGELTFTPSGGMDNGRLPETDRILGEQLRLPK